MLPLGAGYWAIITVIAVSSPAYNETFAAGRNQVAGAILGGLVGIGVIVAHEHGIPLVAAITAGLVPLAVVTGRWPNLRLSCTTLIILTMIPTAGSPYLRALTRFVEILIGALSSIVVARILFPRRPSA